MGLGDLWDELAAWQQHLQLQGQVAPSTIIYYGQDARRFISWAMQHYGVMHLHAVTKEQAMAYEHHLCGRGYTDETVRRAMTALTAWREYVQTIQGDELGPAIGPVIDRAPAAPVISFRSFHSFANPFRSAFVPPPSTVLNWQEWKQVVDAVEHRRVHDHGLAAMVVALFRFIGLHLEEAVALRPMDIVFLPLSYTWDPLCPGDRSSHPASPSASQSASHSEEYSNRLTRTDGSPICIIQSQHSTHPRVIPLVSSAWYPIHAYLTGQTSLTASNERPSGTRGTRGSRRLERSDQNQHRSRSQVAVRSDRSDRSDQSKSTPPLSSSTGTAFVGRALQPLLQGQRGPLTDRGVRKLLTVVGQQAGLPVSLTPQLLRHTFKYALQYPILYGEPHRPVSPDVLQYLLSGSALTGPFPLSTLYQALGLPWLPVDDPADVRQLDRFLLHT